MYVIAIDNKHKLIGRLSLQSSRFGSTDTSIPGEWQMLLLA